MKKIKQSIKITRKAWNILMAMTLMAAGLFGFVKINDVVASSTPITLPGGTSSQGAYDAYMVGVDSPAASGNSLFVKGSKQSIRTSNWKGGYHNGGPTVSELMPEIFETSKGEYVATLMGNEGSFSNHLMKYDENWKSINSVSLGAGAPYGIVGGRDPLTPSILSEVRIYGYDGTNNYKPYLDVYNDNFNKISSQYLPISVGNYLSDSGVVVRNKGYDGKLILDFLDVSSSQISYKESKVFTIGDYQGAAFWGDTGLAFPMGEGKYAIIQRMYYEGHAITTKWSTNVFIYDSIANTLKYSFSEYDVSKANSVTYLGLTQDGNAIFSEPSKYKIRVADKDTGIIIPSLDKTFTIEKLNVQKLIRLKKPLTSAKYMAVGSASAKGELAGYGFDTGVVIVGLDENLNIVDGTGVTTNGPHLISDAKETLDGKIIFSGQTQSNQSGLFGINTTLGASNRAFYGGFDLTIDDAPLLQKVQSMNIKLDGTQDANTIDTTMLAPLKKAMSNGTANLETNPLDDYTTNTKILERVNKNVYNTDYQTTPIDWSKLGLTAKTHPVTGNTTYEAGPNTDVTYFVNDESMNETVTSGRVNIIDEATIVGPENPTDPTDTDNTYALKANNVRVHKDDVAALDIKTTAQVKAWNLKTSVIETAKAVGDKTSVPATVGVYPVTYTYEGLTQTIYVTVYDNNTTAGPEAPATPDNLKNDDALYAIGGIYRLGEVANKTLAEITGVKAWDMNTGQTNTINHTVSVNGVASSYDKSQVGTYDITYTAGNATKTVSVTLVSGTEPVLQVNPPVVTLNLGDTSPTILTGVSATDAEAVPTDITANVSASHTTIPTNQPGIHYVEYSVTDSDFNTVKGLRTYLVEPSKVGTDYAIFAKNFTTQLANVDTSETAIIQKGEATAHRLSKNEAGTIKVKSGSTYGPTVGPHTITYYVNEEPGTDKPIIASVIQNGIAGPKYAIEATNVSMRVSEVGSRKQLQLLAPIAWNTVDGTVETNNIVITNESPTYKKEAGTYTITLSIGAGSDAQTLTKTITLLSGGAPTVTVNPDRIFVPLDGDAIITAPTITVTDLEEPGLSATPDITHIDTSVQGVTVVTYTARDEDGNSASATRQYIIGDNPVVGTHHVLFAKNFTKHIDDVDTSDGAIKANDSADVSAFELATGNPVAVSLAKGTYGPTVGPHTIGVSVDAESTVKKNVIASVYKHGDPSQTEIVEGQSVTKRKSEVTGASLRSLVQPMAWNQTTGVVVGTNVTSTPVYAGQVGVYATTIETTSALKTKKAVTVTIQAGTPPVITGPAVIELTQNQTVNLSDQLTISDAEDGPIAVSKLQISGQNVDTSTVGTYFVNYDVADNDGNSATTFTRAYTVGAKVVKDGYALFATDQTQRVGQVTNTTAEGIRVLTGAKAVNLTTQAVEPAEITNTDGYSNTPANYTATFAANNAPSVTSTIRLNVITGDKPVIVDSTPIVEVAVGGTIAITDNLSVTDTEDNPVANPIVVTGDTVDTAVPGIYHVTYTVTDSDTNVSLPVKRIYVVGAAIVKDGHALFANDFTKRVSLAPTNNAGLISASDAKAYVLATKAPATVFVKTAVDYVFSPIPVARDEAYTITLGVTGTTVTTDILATIVTGDAPVIHNPNTIVELPLNTTVDLNLLKTNITATDTEDTIPTSKVTTNVATFSTTTQGIHTITYNVTDSDGNAATPVVRHYVVGAKVVKNEYAIFAQDFAKRISEVDVLDTAGILTTDAKVTAYHIPTNTPATPLLVSLGTYGPTLGTHTLTVVISEDNTVTTTVKATVGSGSIPVLTNTKPVVELTLGSVITEAQIRANVTATDADETGLTPNITLGGDTLDTATAGVYTVTYDVTDSDGNPAAQVIRRYVVGSAGPVVGNYAIFGQDFTKRVGQVKTTPAVVLGPTAANVYAIDLRDLSRTTAVTLAGGSGYSTTPKVYTLQFTVDNEPATSGKVKGTVITGDRPVIAVATPVETYALGATLPVLTTGVSATDTEDDQEGIVDTTGNIVVSGDTAIDMSVPGVHIVTYTVTDTDTNTAVAQTKTIVVGAKFVENGYAIFANDFSRRIGEVKSANADILLAAGTNNTNAYGVNLATKAKVGLSVESKGGYDTKPIEADAYLVNLSITANRSVNTNITATVTTGDKPVLTFTPGTAVITLEKDANKPALTADVTPSDTEDTTALLTPKIVASGDTTFSTAVPGVYHVTYDVIDSDRNSADTVTRVYVVGSRFVEGDYAIFANDYSKRLGEYTTSPATILASAGPATATNIQTKQPATVTVKDVSGYTKVVGDHTVILGIAESPTFEQAITVTLTSGTGPTLLDTTPVVSIPLNSTINARDNVSASDLEDTDITANIQVSGTGFSTAIEGVHHVTYTVSDSDDNAATPITRIYVVGSLVTSGDYAIFANGFTKSVGEVTDTSNPTIIQFAGKGGNPAYAINIKDSNLPATLQVKNNGNFSSTPADYTIAFEVAENTSVSATIIGRVITGAKPVIVDSTPLVELPIGATVTPTDNVSVTDIEDPSVDLIVSGDSVDTATAGVYKVAYDAVDSDSNSAETVVRTYVIGASGPVNNKYVVFSTDFSRRVGQVQTADAQMITAASAYAVNVETTERSTVTLQSGHGYTATPGTYPLTFKATAYPLATGQSTAKVVTGDIPVIIDSTPVVELPVGASVTLGANVVAHDTEDGANLLVTNITGTVDTTQPGVYHVQYRFTDSDSNAALAVTRSYVIGAKGPVVDGYAVFATDFTRRVGLVDTTPAAIITAANAYSQDITTLAIGTGGITDAGGYSITPANYAVIFHATDAVTAVGTIEARVITGDKPVLVDSTEYVELPVNAPAPILSDNIIATDTEDGAALQLATTDIAGSVDTSTAGIYPITYTYTDTDTNDATPVTRYYVIGASGPVEGEYVIFGDDFSKRINEVDTSHTAIVAAANARVVHIPTQTTTAAEVDSIGTYRRTIGTYTLRFKATGTTATGTNLATVYTGGIPVIVDSTPRVLLDVDAAAPDVLADVIAQDAEDGPNLPLSASNATGSVDTHTPGVYHITYNYRDIDTNAAVEVTRAYIVGATIPPNPTDNYVVFATDFARRIGQVDTSDAAITTAAQPFAQHIDTLERSVALVDDIGTYGPIVGAHTITFKAPLEPTSKGTAIATVTTGEAPVLVDSTPIVELAVGAPQPVKTADIVANDAEDGLGLTLATSSGVVDTTQPGIYDVTYNFTDSDGNPALPVVRQYVVGAAGPVVDGYAIFAIDFSKRIAEVDLTPSTIIDTDAQAYAIDVVTKERSTVSITDLAGYSATQGTYDIVFASTLNPATSGSARATVTIGNPPTLVDNTPVVALSLNAAQPDVLADITASDIEDGPNLPLNATHVSGSVDTTTRGIYTITYNYTDTDLNAALPINRVYVIDSVGPLVGSYAIFANNFNRRVGGVDTSHGAILAPDASNATAEHLFGGAPGTVTITSIGGYNPTVGTYPITFGIVEEPLATGTINATVISGDAPVLTDTTPLVQLEIGAVAPILSADITATDTEDGDITATIRQSGDTVDTTQKGVYHVTYDVKDSDTNQATTVTRIYVVGATGTVTTHAIFAKDFTVRIGEVDMADATIITQAEATALSIHTKQQATVAIETLGGYTTSAGTYPITFNVIEEPMTKATQQATVTAGNLPLLVDATPVVELDVDAEIPTLTANITATDSEDGDLTNDIKITGAPVNVTKKGLYTITYRVTDSDGNSATTIRTYVVGALIVTSNYALFAEDFTIDANDVNVKDKEQQIVTRSILTSISTNDTPGEVGSLSVGTAKVKDIGGYTNEAGTYPITLTLQEDETKTAIIHAKVIDTTAPDAPMINPIEAGPTPIITGTGEIGSTITVTFPDGSTIDTIVDGNGNWSITSPGKLDKDDKVTASSKDPSGNVSSPAEQIVTDTTAPNAPTINPIEAGPNPIIGGTGEPGSTITVTFPDRSTAETVVDGNGNWSITSPGKLDKDDKVTAVTKDPSGNTSEPTEQIVTQTTEYTITAKNATVSMSAINNAKQTGELEAFVLDKIEAKVTNEITEAFIAVPEVNITSMATIDLSQTDKYEVIVSYEIPTTKTSEGIERSAVETELTQKATLSKNVVVTIVDDTPYIPGLPVTGENVFQLMIFGAIITLISFIILIFVKRKRDQKYFE